MKKILLLSLMIILGVSVAVSQFGFKGGINIATFGGDDKALNPIEFDSSLVGLPSIDPTSKLGFTGGISYKISLPIVSIQIEALYTQKGAIYETTVPSMGSAKATLKLDYIDIPALVKISPFALPLVHPYIEGGVSYSFLSSAEIKLESPLGSETQDIKDDITKNDLSILIGVGVEITMVDVNIRYVLGQTKIVKDSDAKRYNRGIMLTVGIRMP
jgi:hypothetical protein